MTRTPGALAVALACLVALHSAPAMAQRVILVRPTQAHPEVNEAFNRLRGELQLHGFDVQVVEGTDPSSAELLADAADAGGAVASVSFVESRGHAAVDVWIADRVTGKTTLRTISTSGTEEAPALLALRTTELLQASLREYGGRPAPSDVEGAHPELSDAVVVRFAAAPELPRRWWLGAGLLVVGSFPTPTLAVGPELGLGWQALRWGVRATVSGPALGARFHTSMAGARLRSSLGLVEVNIDPVPRERASFSLLPAFGVAHLSVEGEGALPYVGRDDSAWVGVVGGGGEATLRLGDTVRGFVSSRVLVLIPAPTIRVGENEMAMGRPSWTAAAGLRVAF